MILGVDHLALSCLDLTAGAAFLTTLGGTTRFQEPDLPNVAVKAPYLQRYAPRHGMAFVQPAAGLALELTRHEAPLASPQGPYQVLWGGPVSDVPPAAAVADERWQAVWADAGWPEARCGGWSEFDASLWFAGDGGAAGVRAVLLPVPDVAAAVRFWQEGLGFRAGPSGVTAQGLQWARLELVSPVPAWRMSLLLAEGDRAERPSTLDAAGFPCVALLTNRLTEDLAKAEGAGGMSGTGPFALTVHGKVLAIALLRGPAGEIVELIDVRPA